ncbi:hypothetical protein [Microcystis phage LMM01]|uniref:Uncharacterized protein n=1 Tax=Microcystis phage LMM01 TaxID=2856824 RepID=A0A7Q1_9CAUD|nr:hypothetical protein MaLMM01_gp137 [Microcystis phage LMM01]BAF36228.1 hypothetical protein [Microcystis phage LMM01]
MKTINHNDWTLHNKLKTSILIEPSAETNYLIGKFYDYNSFKLALFYYRLEGNVLYGACFNERY